MSTDLLPVHCPANRYGVPPLRRAYSAWAVLQVVKKFNDLHMRNSPSFSDKRRS